MYSRASSSAYLSLNLQCLTIASKCPQNASTLQLLVLPSLTLVLYYYIDFTSSLFYLFICL